MTWPPRAVAKELGAVVKFVDSSFAKLVEDVTADKCDMYAITTQINRRIQQWAYLDRPDFSFSRRMLAYARKQGLEPVLVWEPRFIPQSVRP